MRTQVLASKTGTAAGSAQSLGPTWVWRRGNEGQRAAPPRTGGQWAGAGGPSGARRAGASPCRRFPSLEAPR